jgi:hypothetical protein
MEAAVDNLLISLFAMASVRTSETMMDKSLCWLVVVGLLQYAAHVVLVSFVNCILDCF